MNSSITPLQKLQSILPQAQLRFQTLPALPGAEFLLLDPSLDDSVISSEQAEKLSDDPPYWIFCWASGQAMVAEIVQKSIAVAGKVVVDFGAGGGVVAIAAVLAGASRVYACEIDPIARDVIAQNCQRNSVEVIVCDSLEAIPGPIDLLLAADVLYEAENSKFLDWFLAAAPSVVVADSRIKNLMHPDYEHYFTAITTSFPDFKEAKANNEVRFYRRLEKFPFPPRDLEERK